MCCNVEALQQTQKRPPDLWDGVEPTGMGEREIRKPVIYPLSYEGVSEA